MGKLCTASLSEPNNSCGWREQRKKRAESEWKHSSRVSLPIVCENPWCIANKHFHNTLILSVRDTKDELELDEKLGNFKVVVVEQNSVIQSLIPAVSWIIALYNTYVRPQRWKLSQTQQKEKKTFLGCIISFYLKLFAEMISCSPQTGQPWRV